MRKLIDLDTAIDTVVKESQVDGAYGYMDTKSIVDLLNDQPSAEPEIVRCKNCVNWIPGHITEHDDFIPPKCGKYQQMVGHSSDDYCSFAERITDA